ITTITSLSEVGYLNTQGVAYDVDISGDFAFIADGSYGLRVINISNATNPYEVSYYNTPGTSKNSVVSNGYAYIADLDYGIRIVDVSDAYNIFENSNFTSPIFSGDLFVNQDYAFLTSIDDGLRIIDISDSYNPLEISYYDTPGQAEDVYVSGIYAFVADGTSGLQIINISNASAPYPVSNLDTPGYAESIVMSGNNVYIADGSEGLRVIDISNITNPFYVGSFNTPGSAWDVFVNNNYAYVADYDYGLRIIDISNPSNPTEIGSYNTPGTSVGVYLSGFYIYLADGNMLRIINVSNPSSPYEVGHYDASGGCFDVFVSGNFAYINDGNIIKVVNISNPSFPSMSGFYQLYGPTGFYCTNGNCYASDNGLYILKYGQDSIIPTSFNLVLPEGYTSDNTPTYIWRKSFDEHFMSYQLFINDTLKANTLDTFFYQTSAISDGQYIWYVVAYDSSNNYRISNQMNTVKIDATNPPSTYLISPLNGSSPNNTKMVWHKTIDNYSGLKNYELEFDDDSIFTNPSVITTIDTAYSASLVENKYYWKVRAIDNCGNAGNWSSVWSFTYLPTGIYEKTNPPKETTRFTTLRFNSNFIEYAFYSKNNEFTVYDLAGKIVYRQMNSSNGIYQFSTKNLKSGIFLIKLKDSSVLINKRIVVIH
ncbi:MAG: T9SS type A sorting domain-containing protein, partial [bacterium]|nr:T9SS type A sorting domain-containing protein [bacterium]